MALVFIKSCTAPAARGTLPSTFATDLGLSGEELIVYPDDKNTSSPSGAARTFFVRQTGGSTIP
jgi:hypothetical protein